MPASAILLVASLAAMLVPAPARRLDTTMAENSTRSTEPGQDAGSPRHVLAGQLPSPPGLQAGDADFLTDEQVLFAHLMHTYEKAVRPVRNASHNVTVKLGITLTQIFDVDEKNQVLTVHVWMDEEWLDEKLMWSPDRFGGIRSLRIPSSLIWTPDIVLYNRCVPAPWPRMGLSSADDYSTGINVINVIVSQTGNIYWPPPVRFRSTCRIDTTYFPFDDQKCTLKMGSWTYHGFQVDVVERSSFVELSNYIDNGEWELLGAVVQRNVVVYPCCPEPYPDLTFTIYIRRRTLYYTYNVIIPCIMLSVLTLLGFWLPANTSEKVTLGLTVLVAFSLFMLLIAESMPATSEFVPLIAIYLTTIMGMTSISVIMAVLVLNIHHRDGREHTVPSWLRLVVLRYLAAALCMRLPKCAPTSDDDALLRQFCGDLVHSLRHTYLRRVRLHNGRDPGPAESVQMDGDAFRTASESAQHGRAKRAEELLISLQAMIEQQCRPRGNVSEWQLIAKVMDRFFFWIYLTCMTSLTIGVLVFVPIIRSNRTHMDADNVPRQS